MIRNIAGLSMGTIAARILATLGQFVLALWVSPAEFGYWAAATSAIAIIGGLTNFGQVNAYLSGGQTSYENVRRTTLNYNSILTVIACGIACLYLLNNDPYIALLAFIAATTIPLTGLADLSYAVGVKHHEYRKLVSIQILAAVGKVSIGIAIAFLFHSVIALALSVLAFNAIQYLGLRRTVRASESGSSQPIDKPKFSVQIKWAINSVAMTMPLQIGFLVVQFLSGKALLGLFFMAFQVTVGISGLVAAPLAKVSLSTLGSLDGRIRTITAVKLASYFGHGMLVIAASATAILPYFSNFVPAEWRPVIPAIVILMASMPLRIIGPVVDSFQQATNRWWQSTSFNVIDTIGTAAASLFVLTNDLIVLVMALTIWKIFLATVRSLIVFWSAGPASNAKLSAPLFIGSIGLCFSTLFISSTLLICITVVFMSLIILTNVKKIFKVAS